MFGDGFDGGEALGLPGLHVELGAVEGTSDLVALQPTLAEVRELVSADVLEGVEFPVHVTKGHGAPLDLVLLNLAGSYLVGRGDFVKLLGH